MSLTDRLSRRGLLKRLGLALATVPVVAALPIQEAAAAPIAVPAAPQFPPEQIVRLPYVASIERRTPVTVELIQRAFHCPHGCQLEGEYNIERLAHVFAVWAPDAKWGDQPRVVFAWERFDQLRGYDEALEIARKLTAEDAQLHSNQDWHHGWEHGVAHGKAIAAQESAPESVVLGALYDFMGYLTTRDTPIVASSRHDASVMLDAFEAWAQMCGISKATPADVMGWQRRLT